MNTQKIERNDKSKRKRKYPAIWIKNEKKLLRNSVEISKILNDFILTLVCIKFLPNILRKTNI